MSAKLIDNYGLSGKDKFILHELLDALESGYVSIRITVNQDGSGEIRASEGIETSLTSATVIGEWKRGDSIEDFLHSFANSYR